LEIALARSFSSNRTRRGGRLFHEILITCAGDAPENFGQSAARPSPKSSAPGQTAAGRMLTVSLTNDLDGSVYI
jgi:hypothetical protein